MEHKPQKEVNSGIESLVVRDGENGIEPLPGSLYPDKCLDCPKILREDYGARKGYCADCVYAEKLQKLFREN